MSALIDFISGDVDRVVIDKTGFTAPFNLLLDFAPCSAGPAPFVRSDDLYRDGGTAWPAAATTSGPVDVLVIDRVERPSED